MEANQTPDNRRMYIYLLVLTVSSTVGFQGWRTLINNFAVEVLGITGQQMGVVQGIREIPGLLALLVIYLLFIISEHRLAALSVLVLGAGVALTGLLPTYAGFICATLILSFGFHYFETVNQSLTLQYFDRSTSPLVFGRLKGIGSGASILTAGTLLLISPCFDFAELYLGLAVAVTLGGLWCFVQDPTDKRLPVQRKRFIVRSKYWLFYALTMMAGARRQVFVAFAVFLLVKKFSYSVSEIAFLFILNNLINYFASPLIGKAIARYGERKILSLEYAALVFIFVGYALTDSKVLAGVLYVLDFLFFNFAIAIRTFFQKIADPQDIAPSMAIGFTINHIVAVIVPVIGGILWMVDSSIPFLAGAGMSLVSLALVQCIGLQVKR